MTDDKIIKALECCLTGGKCSNCMYNVHNAVCVENLIKDAHSLISRQKAEIEGLREENFELKDGYFQKRYEETEHQELQGLRKAWRKSQTDYINLNAEWEGKYKTAKAEAVKEFAERLNNLILPQLITSTLVEKEAYYFCLDEIANLLKEMGVEE